MVIKDQIKKYFILGLAAEFAVSFVLLSFSYAEEISQVPAAAEEGAVEEPPEVQELKNKIEEKSEEIKKLEESAKQYRDEIFYSQNKSKNLKEDLARVERTITQLRRDLNLTEKKLERTSFEIEHLKIETRTKEIAIQKMRRGLAGLIQIIFESDHQGPIDIFLRHNFLSDLLGQLEYILQVKSRIVNTLGALRELKNELEEKKEIAEVKKKELFLLDMVLSDRKKIQENAKKEQANLITITKNGEKKYQELLRETEKKQEKILQQIEELEEELRKKIDSSSLPQERTGLLLWPTESRSVSQGYGETPFTRGAGKHFYKFHNGVDIMGHVGTPIFATDKGQVIAVGDTDRFCPRGAYGKYIVIDHKNNLATMYAHLSLVRVQSGQEVTRGDIIGYIGSSGLSTGPHLHFTLYDARTVEIRLGPVGTCGLLPFGGSLNPLLYL